MTVIPNKDHSRAIVLCCGASALALDPMLVEHYPGIIIGVNWSVRMPFCDYWYTQEGAFMIPPEHCPGVTAGRTIPVYGVPMWKQRKGQTKPPKWWLDLPQGYLSYNQNWLDEKNGVPTNAGRMRLGLCTTPGEVVGRISGAAAINLALHLGAKRIAVLGLDCSKTLDVYDPAFTGTEVDECHDTAWRLFLDSTAAKQIREHWNAKLVNGSPRSYCQTFPQMEPLDAIEWSLNGYINKGEW